MPRTFRYNLVDVFTDVPLTGNPLAVFTKAQGLTTESMQAIAREMNLSETVFFFPPENGGHAKLRIFTPQKELPFAGHPILGAAWVLGQPMEIPRLRLETGVGIIEVEMSRLGGHLDRARMFQPIPELVPYAHGAQLYAALGCPETGAQLAPVVEAKNGPQHILIEVASQGVLDELRPDHSALAKLVPHAGVYVFAQEDDRCFARYFAPAFGINEDPATGSAAGPLGVHLVRLGRLSSGQMMTVLQGQAMRRDSILLVEVAFDRDQITEVSVAGRAVVVARGELLL